MIVIAWDIDDVLNNLMYQYLLYMKTNFYKNTKINELEYQNISNNIPYNLLGLEKKEYYMTLDTFRKKHYINLKPNNKIIEWFKNNKNYYNIAITGTPMQYANLCSYWLFSHFSSYINTFNYVDLRNTSLNKADIINKFSKVDYFIDDSIENINDVKQLNTNTKTKCLLYKQPWNDGLKFTEITNIIESENKI